jgi:DNA-binding MarR family transcriptional regulator
MTMTTVLDGALRREIVADRRPYTVTLTPIGLKLVPKGKRNGIELTWASLVNGDAALAAGLNATLQQMTSRLPQAERPSSRPGRSEKRASAMRETGSS